MRIYDRWMLTSTRRSPGSKLGIPHLVWYDPVWACQCTLAQVCSQRSAAERWPRPIGRRTALSHDCFTMWRRAERLRNAKLFDERQKQIQLPGRRSPGGTREIPHDRLLTVPLSFTEFWSFLKTFFCFQIGVKSSILLAKDGLTDELLNRLDLSSGSQRSPSASASQLWSVPQQQEV